MKKRLIVIVLAVTVITSAAIGATLAYFLDSKEATNTFTVGNVAIELTEPGWTEGGGLADATTVYPGEPLAKDPTVTNTGANPSVVRIKVELPEMPEGVSDITFRNLDTTNWYYDGGYYYYLKPLGIPGDTALSNVTTKLFTHVIMPTDLENGDEVTPYNIVVTAEAVQAQGIFSRFADMADGISLTAPPQFNSTIEFNLVKQMFTTAFGH